MCGIAGIIGRQRGGSLLLHKMLAAQKHRGPDATCQLDLPNAFLGHNRLSIVDLSEEANQPMESACGRYVIVFNGEVYNYRELKSLVPEYPFRTQSDTEVILALYIRFGPSMLGNLNGMFSMLIWDKVENKAFAARDRFGVKPFYYSFSEGNLFFASEIKSLRAGSIATEADWSIWSSYLVRGSYGNQNQGFWKGIRQLPAACSFFYEAERGEEQLKIQSYYDFPARVRAIPERSPQDLKEEYISLLSDAVKLRFRADVPVGFNLSGGLDSSTLLAMVAGVMPGEDEKIKAFTFYCDDERYDEIPWVKGMLAGRSYPFNPVLLDWKTVPEKMEQLAYFQEEPFGGFPTLAYAGIFEAARKEGVIVLLDGQGMDEAWAGYDYYRTNSGSLIQGVSSSPVRPEALEEDFIALAAPDQYESPFDNRLQNLQYRDIFHTKIPRALRFNDRISMMHSTELREPFLDYRLVELAFSQPENVKIRDGQGKWLLRNLVAERLGNNIAFSPKRPLQTPQREWLAHELKDWAMDRIEVFSRLPFVKRDVVLGETDKYFRGNMDNSFYLWQWINASYLL